MQLPIHSKERSVKRQEGEENFINDAPGGNMEEKMLLPFYIYAIRLDTGSDLLHVVA